MKPLNLGVHTLSSNVHRPAFCPFCPPFSCLFLKKKNKKKKKRKQNEKIHRKILPKESQKKALTSLGRGCIMGLANGISTLQAFRP